MKRNYYPAVRGIFGDWVYFSCLMSMREVTERLSFASEIHKSQKLSEWIQRQLKGKRSKQIADYLLREKQRFFNSMVVAIYEGDPAWHGFSHLKPTSKDLDLEDVPDDVEASVGLLSLVGDEKIFAIDGQHRLAGMKEAIKENAKLGDDDVSLVLVPHRSTRAGMQRTRRLFTTLNKTAVPVGKGEIIALDENDVMAIVTRHLVENDDKFGDDRIKFAQTDNLAADAKELTTIGNLYDVLKVVFVKCGSVTNVKELQTIRPDDETIDEYVKLAERFWDGLAQQFTELDEYFSASVAKARQVVAKYRFRKGGHILFRPAGMRLFAEVTGEVVKSGLDLPKALKLVGLLPTALSKPPYRGVLWLPTGNMRAGGRAVCRRLLLHMLKLEKRPDDLKRKYAEVLGVDEAQVSLPDFVRGV
jgi:DNA sulfur modification protein DndB